MKSIIISGTDTDVGKTLLSAILMTGLPQYHYWKPVQCGTEDGTDSETVRRLSECSNDRILSETYLFSQPLSPHAAAKIDNKAITGEKLRLPNVSSIIVEGAGGLLVPLTEDLLNIDIFKTWNLPVLLVCRSGLGTINHTLLSIEALRSRAIPILGCVLMGAINPSNESAIEQYGHVPVVGKVPRLSSFDPASLRAIYNDHFLALTKIL